MAALWYIFQLARGLVFTGFLLHSDCLMHLMVTKQWTWIIFCNIKTTVIQHSDKNTRMDTTEQKDFIYKTELEYSLLGVYVPKFDMTFTLI